MRRALTVSRKNFKNVDHNKPLTKRQIKMKQEYMEVVRHSYEYKHKHQYVFPFQRNYQNQMEKINLYGSEHVLIGQSNDFQNPNFILSVLEEYKPKICLLGGMNRLDLKEMKELYSIYQQTPKIYSSDQDLMAKIRLNKFFTEDMQMNKLYFKMEDDHIIYRNDPQNKECHMEGNLTAAHLYTMAPDRYLMFAKPDIHLQLEDLALRLDVQQLRDIFDHVISYIYEKSETENWEPLYQNHKIFEYIQSISKILYGDVLYEKQSIFATSLFKKSARMFKRSGMVVDSELLQLHKKLSYENVLPEHDMIFRQYINLEKQDILQQQRNRKIKKYFKDDPDQNLIREQLQKDNDKYDFRSETQYYNSLINKEAMYNKEEIIEKYVILSYLIGNHYRNYLECGQDPFKVTIFNDLLKDISVQEKLDIFNKFKSKYFVEMHLLQNHMISLMENSKSQGRYFLVPFKEQVKETIQKKEDVNYKFQIGQKSQFKRYALIVDNLMNQMQQIIIRRQKQGINQKDQIQAMKDVVVGDITEENLHQFNQLLLEANLEMGSPLKFPKKFQRYLGYLTHIQQQYLIQKQTQKLNILEKYTEELIKRKIEGKQYTMISGNNIFKQKIALNNPELLYNEEDYSDSDNENNTSPNFLDKENLNSEDSMYFALGEGECPIDFRNKDIDEIIKLGAQEISQTDITLGEDGKIDDKNNPNIDPKDQEEIKNLIGKLMEEDKEGLEQINKNNFD